MLRTLRLLAALIVIALVVAAGTLAWRERERRKNLQEQLAQSQNRFDSLEQRVEDARKLAQLWESKARELKEQLKELARFKELRDGLQDANETLRQEAEQLRGQLDELQRQLAAATGGDDAAETERLREQIDRLSTELAGRDQRLTELQARFEDRSRALEEAEDRARNLDQRLAQQERRIRDLIARLDKLLQGGASLQQPEPESEPEP